MKMETGTALVALQRRCAWLAAGMVLAASAPAAQAASCKALDKPWREVVQHLRTEMTSEQDVGGSLYLIDNGVVVKKEHIGFADLASRRPIDENTIFHWASITKTFTGIAAMQLVERKLISLDDPLVKYLPEFRKVHNPFGPAEQVTLRHLLTHTSGLRAPTWPWGGESWHPHEPSDWDQLVAMMPYTKIDFQPGSRYGYSNPAVTFLGRVIENVTGDNIEVYIDKNILKPLGMTRSYFDMTPYHLLRDRSNNYVVRNGGPVANGLDFDTGATVANGGLNTPIPDFVRYMNFLAGTGDSRHYETILPRHRLEEMWRPVVKSTLNLPGEIEHVGLAFYTNDFTSEGSGTRRYIGHGGSQKGYRSFFFVEPKSRTGAIWVTNTTVDVPRRLTNDIRQKVFGRLMPLLGSCAPRGAK